MSRPSDPKTPEAPAKDNVPRTVLPYNLAESLRHLTEQDILRLADAVSLEIENRGLAAPKQKSAAARRGTADPALSQLTRSQINLIRSSIQAGVKPSALSRQFGLSRTQITAALNSET